MNTSAKGCGYTINANPKGKDMVMMGEINNYLCQDCKEIVDVVFPYGEKLYVILTNSIINQKPK